MHICKCNTQYLKETAADKTVFGKVSGVVQRTVTNTDAENFICTTQSGHWCG